MYTPIGTQQPKWLKQERIPICSSVLSRIRTAHSVKITNANTGSGSLPNLCVLILYLFSPTASWTLSSAITGAVLLFFLSCLCMWQHSLDPLWGLCHHLNVVSSRKAGGVGSGIVGNTKRMRW